MALKKSELYSSLWSSCDELRGGMDASQYKDYVLVLLFIKYVSDKYAGVPYAPITIPESASFQAATITVDAPPSIHGPCAGPPLGCAGSRACHVLAAAQWRFNLAVTIWAFGHLHFTTVIEREAIVYQKCIALAASSIDAHSTFIAFVRCHFSSLPLFAPNC